MAQFSFAMPARTPCAHCGTVGLVRLEHVIKGGHAFVRHYCGACEHVWDVTPKDEPGKTPTTKSPAADKPDRSRR